MTYRSAIGNTVSCDASSPSLNFEMQRNAKTFSTGKLKNTEILNLIYNPNYYYLNLKSHEPIFSSQ